MGIFNFFPNLYHKASKIGVTQELSFGAKLRIEMCNISAVVGLLPILVHILYNLMGPKELRGFLYPVLFACIFVLTLILNHNRRYFFAKLNSVMSPLLLVAFAHMLYGWGLRPEVMYLLFIMFSMYFFRLRTAYMVGGTILAIFIFVAIRLSIYGPIYEVEILSSAPFGLFIFAMVNGGILTSKVLRENMKYRKNSLEQNKKLEFKNEELERFSYIASHDLKSPLRNIFSFAGLLERDLDRGAYDNLKEYLDYIKTNATHMSGLISDILEVSKIDNEEMEDKEWVDLNALLGQVKTSLFLELQEKSAQISCQKLPSYYCNESQFSLLFQNFIQNGIKYNETAQPTINIWSGEEDGQMLLHFQDNGIGIEEEYHDYIFEYFRRLHNQEEYEGTGIGLGLCKKIVQKYKGEILISSEKGQGSTFTLKLPKPEVHTK